MIKMPHSIIVENEFTGLVFDCPPAPQLCRFADGQARARGVAVELYCVTQDRLKYDCLKWLRRNSARASIGVDVSRS